MPGLVDRDGIIDGEHYQEEDHRQDREGDAKDRGDPACDQEAKTVDDVPLGVQEEKSGRKDGDGESGDPTGERKAKEQGGKRPEDIVEGEQDGQGNQPQDHLLPPQFYEGEHDEGEDEEHADEDEGVRDRGGVFEGGDAGLLHGEGEEDCDHLNDEEHRRHRQNGCVIPDIHFKPLLISLD